MSFGFLPIDLKYKVLASEINDEVAEASALTNLGSIYSVQGNNKLAIESLEKSLEIKKKLGNKKGMGVSLNNLGAVYYNMKDFDKALQFFEEAYILYIELDDKKSIFPACNNIGFINLEKGNNAKALEYFNKAYELVKLTESTSKKIACLENLTLVHKALGNTSQALDFSVECCNLKDTLFNTKQAEITVEMQSKFGSEKKQKENETKSDEYYKKAIPYLEQALAIKPSDKATIYALRTLYYKTGNEAKGKEMSNKLK